MLKNSTKKHLTSEQISKTVLSVMQSDARVGNLICTHLIPDIMLGYQIHNNQLVDSQGDKVAVRVFTESGCDLTPSGMRGVGRKFDLEEFERYYNEDVGMVLLVDVSNLPEIEIVEVLGCEIASTATRRIPVSDRIKFLIDLKSKTS